MPLPEVAEYQLLWSILAVVAAVAVIGHLTEDGQMVLVQVDRESLLYLTRPLRVFLHPLQSYQVMLSILPMFILLVRARWPIPSQVSQVQI